METRDFCSDLVISLLSFGVFTLKSKLQRSLWVQKDERTSLEQFINVDVDFISEKTLLFMRGLLN